MRKPHAGVGCLAVPFAAVWIGLWSAGTLTFDGFLVANVWSQLQSLSFPSVPGTIVSSEVEERSDSEGTSHKAVIRYRYHAAGQERTGDTLQGLQMSFGSRAAQEQVRRFPAGKQVPVYYDPERPDVSLLEPGLHSGHAFLALFLVPFNVILFGSWLLAWDFVIKPRAGTLPPGVTLQQSFEGFRLTVYETSPLAVGAAAALASSFVGVFLVAFGQMVLPAAPLLLLVWLAVVCASVLAYRRQLLKGRVLTINELRSTAELGDGQGHHPTATMRLENVADIKLRTDTKLDSEGELRHTYTVCLAEHRKDGDQVEHDLVSGWSQLPAEQLAEWLRVRLGQRIHVAQA